MPRKKPTLVPFLLNALNTKIRNKSNQLKPKYRNLFYDNNRKFSLAFPHRNKRLNIKDELLFKDWFTETGRNYNFREDYSNARQAMTSSLRKSDYVKLDIYKNKLTCTILTAEEVKEKKILKKLKNEERKKKEENDALNDSGYDSGFPSPESNLDHEQKEIDVLQGVEHDHAYGFSPPDRAIAERRGFYNLQNESEEAMDTEAITETFDVYTPDHYKSSVMGLCGSVDVFSIPGLSEDCTLEDLYKIPDEQFIGKADQELRLTPQVPVLTDVKEKKTEKVFICKRYEPMGESTLLICEVYGEIEVGCADTSGGIRIICEEAIQGKIQEFSSVKELLPVNDQYLMVLLEHPLI